MPFESVEMTAFILGLYFMATTGASCKCTAAIGSFFLFEYIEYIFITGIILSAMAIL